MKSGWSTSQCWKKGGHQHYASGESEDDNIKSNLLDRKSQGAGGNEDPITSPSSGRRRGREKTDLKKSARAGKQIGVNLHEEQCQKKLRIKRLQSKGGTGCSLSLSEGEEAQKRQLVQKKRKCQREQQAGISTSYKRGDGKGP